MARLLYTLCVYLAVPGILGWLAYRGRRDPRYRARWRERLGWCAYPGADYWLHAASVGEVQAALPVLRALRVQRPDARILVTTVTPTGAAQLRESLGETVEHCYLPLDLPGAVERFFARVQPRAGLIMELELWPNLLAAARARDLPLVLINGRLSERSLGRYLRLGGLIRNALTAFSAIAAQSEADAERLRRLCDDGRVHTTGNVKFDIPPPENLEPLRRQFAEMIDGGQRPVWVAGSVRDGETEILLQAHRLLRASLPSAVLVLVPRHPERFDDVERICHEQGMAPRRRSHSYPLASTDAVLLGDSMGELGAYYAVGHVAFVGGTLVPIGGHNVLEPAGLGRAVIVGPYTANVAGAVELLAEGGALVSANDAEELAAVLRQWLANPADALAAGERAAAVVAHNQGAVMRSLALIGLDTAPERSKKPA